MPHISVHMYPGRTEEIKKNLAEKLKDTLMEELKCPESSVTVSIHDVQPENFKEEVMDKIADENYFIKN